MAKLGDGVTAQIVAGTKTVVDNPNCVRLHPQLRKAAGPLGASGRQRGENGESEVKICKIRNQRCRKIDCNIGLHEKSCTFAF